MNKQTKVFKNLKTFKLENGLEVIFIPNKTSPAVTVGVLYKYGFGDDSFDLIGIAHFLEHMMFKGTKKYPKGEFDKTIQESGGFLNAYTWYDLTFYHQMVPLKFLEKVLELEADRMVNLAFEDKEFYPERDVVLEERKMRVNNHPLGELSEVLMKAKHLYHPYGMEGIGYPHHINAYTPENTREAYKKWYAPNNAVLIISGNVSEEEIKKLVKKHYGHLKPSNKIPKTRNRPKDPKIPGLTQYIFQKNERFSNVLIELAYPQPSLLELNDPVKFMAYKVALKILGGNDTSVLYKEFVKDKKLAIKIGTYSPTMLDPEHCEISAELTRDMDSKKFLEHFKEFIKEFGEDKINQDWFIKRFDEVKNQMIKNIAFTFDGTHTSVMGFDDIAYGFSVDQINDIKNIVYKVKIEDVKNIIKDFAKKPEVITVVHHPDYNTNLEVLS